MHRDVRVALLRAFWDHLEDERVWPILEAAANSKDAAIAIMVARTTAPRISKTTRRRLNGLLARLLSHPESRVRMEVLYQAARGVISDPEKQLQAPLLAVLESKLPDEYQAAMRAILNIYTGQTGKESPLVAAAFGRVLPRRQAFSEILEQFLPYCNWYAGYKKIGRAIMDMMATDPLALSLRLKLAFVVLSPADFAVTVETEIANQSLHAEALMKLAQQLESGSRWDYNTKTLAFLSERWIASPTPELRRLALAALVGQSLGSQGRKRTRLTQLKQLRNDESPLVAAAAQWVFPNAKEKE